MSEVALPEKKTTGGCGLFNAVFGTKKLWPRRSSSTGSLHTYSTSGNDDIGNTDGRPKRIPSAGHNPKRRTDSFDAQQSVPLSGFQQPPPQVQVQMHYQQQQNLNIPHGRKQSSNDNSRTMTVPQPPQPSQNNGQNTRKTVPKESLGISGELESMIAEQQRNKGGANLVRVSSGNVMVHSNLGNLRQPGGSPYTYSKPSSKDKEDPQLGLYTSNNKPARYPTSGMGNIVSKKIQAQQPLPQENGVKATGGNSLCRALSCRIDPEELKIFGNEDYKNGRFAEALAFYERAIDLDPTKASYRSNKSAALTALGRLLEAVFECKEAINIEPKYHRAHHRLANLYLRLGDVEKSMYHYKQAGPEADPDAISKARLALGHLKKCDEAKRLKDWHTVLKESNNAIAAGADSAPMVIALQAEAYLKLHRHQEADTTLTNGPHFDVDQCVKVFGPYVNATLLVIRAQVDLVTGRFDDAMEAIQHAGRLDPSNRDVSIVTRRIRAVSTARSNGNDLFKDSRFSEACVSYREGLEHDPYNSVLLCNRAACRTKLCQFEKAIDDCTAALNVRPSYTKARLRRADSYVKLGKWEAAIKDYEILLQESPGDVDVGKALFEAQLQLRKLQGEDVSDMKFGDDGVVEVQNNEQFKHLTSWPGLSVALFVNKPGDKRILQVSEQLSKRYPTVKFLKVEAEDNRSLVKSENVNSLPVCKLYRNGYTAAEVSGEDHQGIENSIKEQLE